MELSSQLKLRLHSHVRWEEHFFLLCLLIIFKSLKTKMIEN